MTKYRSSMLCNYAGHLIKANESVNLFLEWNGLPENQYYENYTFVTRKIVHSVMLEYIRHNNFLRCDGAIRNDTIGSPSISTIK